MKKLCVLAPLLGSIAILSMLLEAKGQNSAPNSLQNKQVIGGSTKPSLGSPAANVNGAVGNVNQVNASGKNINQNVNAAGASLNTNPSAFPAQGALGQEASQSIGNLGRFLDTAQGALNQSVTDGADLGIGGAAAGAAAQFGSGQGTEGANPGQQVGASSAAASSGAAASILQDFASGGSSDSGQGSSSNNSNNSQGSGSSSGSGNSVNDGNGASTGEAGDFSSTAGSNTGIFQDPTKGSGGIGVQNIIEGTPGLIDTNGAAGLNQNLLSVPAPGTASRTARSNRQGADDGLRVSPFSGGGSFKQGFGVSNQNGASRISGFSGVGTPSNSPVLIKGTPASAQTLGGTLPGVRTPATGISGGALPGLGGRLPSSSVSGSGRVPLVPPAAGLNKIPASIPNLGGLNSSRTPVFNVPARIPIVAPAAAGTTSFSTGVGRLPQSSSSPANGGSVAGTNRTQLAPARIGR